jgi:hypothetical protein
VCRFAAEEFVTSWVEPSWRYSDEPAGYNIEVAFISVYIFKESLRVALVNMGIQSLSGLHDDPCDKPSLS